MKRYIQFLAFLSACTANAQFTETKLGGGYEPAIIANRQPTGPDSHNGWVATRMLPIPGQPTHYNIVRNYSFDQGTNWLPNPITTPNGDPVFADNTVNRYDPCLAANLTTGEFLYGWELSASTTASLVSVRTAWDMTLPASTTDVASDVCYDRPFLASAFSGNAYMSWYCDSASGTDGFKIRRGQFSTPPSTTFQWIGVPLFWYTRASGLTTVPGAPIVAGYSAGPSGDYVYGLLLQYVPGQSSDPDNQLKIYRSTDSGTTWDTSGRTLAVYQSSPTDAGFGIGVQNKMADFTVCAEPGGHKVYVFYAKTKLTIPTEEEPTPRKYQNLYCRYSTNDGVDWSSPVLVQGGGGFTPTFANSLSDTRFYRIGRVSACVDPYGSVHVFWFDNRNGVHANNANHDRWSLRHQQSSNNGQTWQTNSDAVATVDSEGGLGLPNYPSGFAPAYLPPGDVISCDADRGKVIAAWGDTRSGTAEIYVGGKTIP